MEQEALQSLVDKALRAKIFENRGVFSPKRMKDIGAQLSQVILSEQDSLVSLGKQLNQEGLGLGSLQHVSMVVTGGLIQMQESEQVLVLNQRMAELVQGYHEAEAMRIRMEQGGIHLAMQRALDEMAQRTQKLEVEIEERKQVAEALQKAKDAAEAANRAKSSFLATMSHELRTPLNAILGYAQLLQLRAMVQGPQDILPDLEKIRGAGNHLLSLISDILDISKIEADKMELTVEDVDINELVEEIASTIAPIVEKNNNSFAVHVAPNIGIMDADAAKLKQVMLNLVGNAGKFTEGGRVELLVDRRVVEGEDWISFAVHDTGIGIPHDKLTQLFQPFTQVDSSSSRKYGGTGLGLAISRRLAQLMGGEITLQSEVGRGSTFTLHLPARSPELVERSMAAGLRPRQNVQDFNLVDGSVVLVIDDDTTSRDLLTRYLSAEGFQLVVASSGAEGIQLARLWKPAVITLDVLMPEMDGWTVLGALKSDPELSKIPVIMLTMVDDQSTGFSLGASDYLMKPIHREQLLSTLGKYCAPAPQAAQEDRQLVLVVEDDEDTRDVLRRLLDQAGYRTIEAGNGKIGIERMTIWQPNVVLLDLMMPEMDGFEFVNQLHRHPTWRNIPIIVITAMELTAEDHRRLNSHIEGILQKGSYTREELLDHVREMVRKSMRAARD